MFANLTIVVFGALRVNSVNHTFSWYTGDLYVYLFPILIITWQDFDSDSLSSW